jgi:hypothetical protein
MAVWDPHDGLARRGRERTGVCLEEASMHTHALPRLLLAGFTIALVAFGVLSAPAAAADTTNWPETTGHENVLVQSCSSFSIISSYTTDREDHVVKDYTGQSVYERRDVTFSGTLANTSTDKAYLYDGHFTRSANWDLGEVRISDLLLRFEVGTPGEFSFSLGKADFDLADSPPAVVQAIVPHVLHMDLCYLFGDSPRKCEPSAPGRLDLLHPGC